jgi:hypothetical protein
VTYFFNKNKPSRHLLTRTLDQLDRLVSQNEAANAQRKQFKNQCKAELEELQARNE